jgi:hypothetical protein
VEEWGSFHTFALDARAVSSGFKARAVACSVFTVQCGDADIPRSQ